MDLGLVACVVLPLGSFMAIGGGLVYHFARWNAETSFETDLKALRKLWLMGEIDGKTYRYIKDSMKVEELFNTESEKLDKMLKEKQLDQFDYIRVKKILQMALNNKLVKIENAYMPEKMQKIIFHQIPA